MVLKRENAGKYTDLSERDQNEAFLFEMIKRQHGEPAK